MAEKKGRSSLSINVVVFITFSLYFHFKFKFVTTSPSLKSLKTNHFEVDGWSWPLDSLFLLFLLYHQSPRAYPEHTTESWNLCLGMQILKLKLPTWWGMYFSRNKSMLPSLPSNVDRRRQAPSWTKTTWLIEDKPRPEQRPHGSLDHFLKFSQKQDGGSSIHLSFFLTFSPTTTTRAPICFHTCAKFRWAKVSAAQIWSPFMGTRVEMRNKKSYLNEKRDSVIT